jgi:Alpha/beta hydrolase domain
VTLFRLDLHPPLVFSEAATCQEGQAEFAVLPEDPANAPIVDLDLAPRDSQGRVHFTADVRILRPIGTSARGLFLDVPNRGASIFARMLEPGPMGPATQISEGFLLRRGFSIVTCGWQHDVPRGNGRFGLSAPSGLKDGQPLVGPVTTTSQIDGPTDVLAPDSNYVPFDLDSATLTQRADPDDPPILVPRDQWTLTADGHAHYAFVPGNTYALTYTAVGAPVTGVGFLALRDLVACLRERDQLQFAIAMGASQTGRLLRQMVDLGLCADESGRLEIDGMLAVAAGARFADVNRRFGQPSSQEPTLVSPVDAGLFSTPAPKLMLLNTSSEYCSSSSPKHLSAALSHLTAYTSADLDVPDNLRIYLCASTQHAPSPLPFGSGDGPARRGVNPPNTIDYKPFVRACVDNLTRWVVDGVEPPPSVYPRLDDGTLSAELRSVVDADGNEVAGIRHPDVSVPLGTYLGWNPRHPATGAPQLPMRAMGSTIPFSADAIAARYGTRDAFLTQIRIAAEALAAQRYVLSEDIPAIVSASANRWDLFTSPSP